jgi:hypothetical protein
MFHIWGREGKTRLLFNHHVQLHVPATLLLVKMSQVHNEQVVGGGPRHDIDAWVKRRNSCPCRETNHDLLHVQPVASILYQLRYPSSEYVFLCNLYEPSRA